MANTDSDRRTEPPEGGGYVVVPLQDDKLRPVRIVADRIGRLLRPPLLLLLAGLVGLALYVAWDVYPTSRPASPVAPEQPPGITSSSPEPDQPAAVAASTSQPNAPRSDEASTPEPKVATGPDEIGGSFWVRVGAFRDRANADRLRSALENQSQAARISTLPSGLHAVEVGPFPERSGANSAARHVSDLTGLTPIIMTRGQPVADDGGR